MDLKVQANSTREKKAMSFNNVLSLENGFRGFQKLPIVLLERMDITPLLKSKGFENSHNRNQVINGVQKLHSHKLSLQVSVVLVRTDLDKLKRELNETGNLSNNISQKSNKTLGRLRSSAKNLWSSLLKDEKQPLKRVSFSDLVTVHEISSHKRCTKCIKISKNHKSLKLHMKQKHQSYKYICDQCSKNFNSMSLFKKHLKLHCKTCGKQLENEYEYLDQKIKNCSLKKLYICEMCKETGRRSLLPEIVKQEKIKATLESTRHLKIVKGNGSTTKMKAISSLKECVSKKKYSSPLLIDLTNEGESDNAVKISNTSTKYINVLKDKTANENSTNNLCVNNSSNQLCQNSNDQSYFIADTINFNNPPRKAIIDPKSKKTIISRYHCEICGKYLSSNFTLMRHKITMHTADAEFGCNFCGEKFERTSLLESHRCPCKNVWCDPAPVIPFNNMANSSDVLNIDEVACIDEDFEIPVPIVELTEYNDSEPFVNGINNMLCVVPLENKLYNLVVQEVPIEF